MSAYPVYLGLGSNTEPERHLATGLLALRQHFGTVSVSPIYRTQAVGFEGRDFLNAAARIETRLTPGELKDWLTELENRHGRDRSQPKFSDRTLDIDILIHGESVGDFNGLRLPRPEILEYAHVLKPLADLAPDWVHPETGQTLAQHWQGFAGDRSLEPVSLGPNEVQQANRDTRQ